MIPSTDNVALLRRMSQLLRATVSIDESNLHAYLRQLVETSNLQLRGEMTSLQRQVTTLSQTVVRLSEDISDIKEHGTGRLEHDEEEETRQQEELKKAHQDQLNAMITGAVERKLSNMTECISAVEKQLQHLQTHQEEQQFSLLNEFSSLRSEQHLHSSSHDTLLSYLGLEHNATFEGIVRTCASEDAEFMTEHKHAMVEHSKRIAAVEASLKNKIEKAELEDLHFALSDVKGFAAAAVSNLASHDRKMETFVRDVSNELRTENQGKVSWTDLDAWKASMAEAASGTRKASVEALVSVDRLEKEVATLKISLSRPTHAPVPELEVQAAAPTSTSNPNPPEGMSAVRRRLNATNRYAEYAEVAGRTPSPLKSRRPMSAQSSRPKERDTVL